MNSDYVSKLGWLPAPAEDFRAKLKSWSQESNPGDFLRQLSGQALNLNQQNQLARQIRKAQEAGTDFGKLTPYRLGVVSNATIDHILPAITASGLRHGLLIEIIPAPFDQVIQVAAGQVAELNEAGCDAVLCAIDMNGLPSNPGLFTEHADAEAAVTYLHQVAEGIERSVGAPCVLQTVVPLAGSAFGSLDRRTVGTSRRFADEVNRGLARISFESNALLLDVAALAELLGTANWYDPQLHAIAKMPFAQDYVPVYAEHLCRLLGAHKGKSRRCLVLDLDNTLWGGVIGDDGLGGIALGQGDPVGEAYLDIQKTALQLRDRGIVLAVSSKNEDAIAREPFREHPDMILKEDHIAVFKANWDNKAENIAVIAKELSLGLDSFVFLDDNPMERALVRGQLPEVAVPEIPEEPALIPFALRSAGYFESIHFSAEDRKRADDYQAQAKRTVARDAFVDMDEFLRSLKMEATVQPFQPDSLKRVTQLVNKSNQFNLTTKRYSEVEIAAIAAGEGFRTWQVRLADAYGDNGLISVIIVKAQSGVWEIDTWLMSCRVLGRRLEELVLQEIVAAAASEGVEKLVGVYTPTDRNMMVEKLYPALGFVAAENDISVQPGSSSWQLNVKDYSAPDLPFLVAHG